MKSRTAVEILFNEIQFGLYLWFKSEITDEEFFSGLTDAHKDALKFEREQLRKAYRIDSHKKESKSFNNYYNDTFNNKNDEMESNI